MLLVQYFPFHEKVKNQEKMENKLKFGLCAILHEFVFDWLPSKLIYGKCSKISNTLKLGTPKIIAENNF